MQQQDGESNLDHTQFIEQNGRDPLTGLSFPGNEISIMDGWGTNWFRAYPISWALLGNIADFS